MVAFSKGGPRYELDCKLPTGRRITLKATGWMKLSASFQTCPVSREARLCQPRNLPVRHSSFCRTRSISDDHRRLGEAAGPEGFTEPDMILKPDFSTASAAPWTGDWTLQVIHDAFTRDGDPIPFSPRNVLKRVVALYAERGLTPVVAPEMEFFLVARNLDPAQAIEPMMGRSGRPAAARQAYSMSAVDEYGPVIDDIYDFAEAQGFEIDGITQEGGAGQVEINLRHGDPVKLADEVFYFKRLIREAALKHDCFATFMAKPIAGEPGSAMHIHHSFLDADGNNIFSGPRAGKPMRFSTLSAD